MRKSNIELLRIILFFIVVTIHISTPYLTNNHNVYLFNWQFSNFIDGFSRVCVDCFVILTGYFYISFSSDKINKQFKKITYPILFYLFFYFGLIFVFDTQNMHFTQRIVVCFKNLSLGLFNGSGYFYHFWYILVLLVLMLFANYLNILINSIDKKNLIKLLIILTIIFSIIPSLEYALNYSFVDDTLFFSKLSLFIYLYVVGAYIRLYGKNEFSKMKLALVFFISQLSIIAISFIYNSNYSPILFFYKMKGNNIIYPLNGFAGISFAYDFILVIFSSVILILLTLKFEFYSTFINKISSATYGAYIIHVFWIIVLINLPFNIKINPTLKYNSHYYFLYVSVAIFLVAVISIITEYIRIGLFKKISKWKAD